MLTKNITIVIFEQKMNSNSRIIIYIHHNLVNITTVGQFHDYIHNIVGEPPLLLTLLFLNCAHPSATFCCLVSLADLVIIITCQALVS